MIYRLIALLGILSITIFYSVYKKKSFESQLIGDFKAESVLKKMPSGSFVTLDGNDFGLDEVFVNERIDLLVVHYWGTWCAPCEAELPELLGFIKEFESKPGVKFLLVATNDEAVKVKKHLQSLKFETKANVAWLLDNKNAHRELFGTTRVPETYVFSSDKTTLRKFIGPQEWNKPLYLQTFDDLLQISTHKL